MTFNPNANISGGKASKRGRNTGIAVGGGVGVLALFLLSQFLGFDLTSLVGGGQTPASDSSLEQCLTGADANENVECRMKGASASLERYWVAEAEELGFDYVGPTDLILFEGATTTGCGNASSATGPFYCPPDQTIYIDVSFYDELRGRFGSSGGPLAEMYVIAHEWGHHVQNLLGILERSQDGQTGPTSNAVRVELQADCFAGAWAANASEVPDESGVPFLQELTPAQIQDALSAASAVGDDRIQQATQGQVNPHSFTHGTSEQRVGLFETGFQRGAAACDTFNVAPENL
jgi:predicted metalloprotease